MDPELSIDRLIKLIEQIHETTQDELRWPQVLRALTQSLEARGAFLYSPHEIDGARSIGHSIDIEPPMWPDYRALYANQDVMLRALKTSDQMSAGSVATNDDLVPTETFLRTPLYTDFLAPRGIHHVLGAVLVDEADADLGPRIHLALFRGRELPQFGAPEIALVKRLAPHLKLALCSRWRLQSRGLFSAASEYMLDAMDHPVLLLDEHGKVIYANAAALELVTAGVGLTIAGDEIRLDSLKLQPLLKLLNPASRVPVSFPTGDLNVRVIPFGNDSSEGKLFHWFARAAYAVLPEVRPYQLQRAATRVGSQYSFTDSEAEVVSALLAGLGPAAIGTKLKISVSTVRSHLAHIYAKTGTRNQRELILKLMTPL